MSRIVISQPMYFPWLGLFEQLRAADIFVHLDDVQLPQGRSFITRVQIKTSTGIRWLTVPVRHYGRQLIHETQIDPEQNWQLRHLRTLQHSYAHAPYVTEMLELVRNSLDSGMDNLAELNIRAIENVAAYLGLECTFRRSSEFNVSVTSSRKLLELVQRLDGTTYITGHGARNYLDHELFENNGITVEYIDYARYPYPQLHGDFDPHVSILDTVANVGRATVRCMRSSFHNWKEFLNERCGTVQS